MQNLKTSVRLPLMSTFLNQRGYKTALNGYFMVKHKWCCNYIAFLSKALLQFTSHSLIHMHTMAASYHPAVQPAE